MDTFQNGSFSYSNRYKLNCLRLYIHCNLSSLCYSPLCLLLLFACFISYILSKRIILIVKAICKIVWLRMSTWKIDGASPCFIFCCLFIVLLITIQNHFVLSKRLFHINDTLILASSPLQCKVFLFIYIFPVNKYINIRNYLPTCKPLICI